MDIRFFNDLWEQYSGSDDYDWGEYHQSLFQELSKIQPEDLLEDHLIWMKRCELYYAQVEDYDRANILKQLQLAAMNIFQARKNLEQIKNNFYNK